MKLQHLTVIFVIIVIPLVLILSVYTQSQIDILSLQNQYDTVLINATYDGIKAFEMNASYNNLRNVSDTLREDVDAAISTFMKSMATSMGVYGDGKTQMLNYVPAVLFTLYDGYYIYSPTRTENGYEYMLKPYNFYTVRYVHNDLDIIVNYTLDNYIVVYGWIPGEGYVTKSGYLVTNEEDKEKVVTKETLKAFVPFKQFTILNGRKTLAEEIKFGIKNVTDDVYDPEYVNKLNGAQDTRVDALYPRNENFYVDSESATKYYTESIEFTNWVVDKLKFVQAKDAMRNGEKIEEFKDDESKIFALDKDDNNPESPVSIFSDHKTQVIKNSIQDNLNQAITAYSQGSDTTYDFKLPKLTEAEWDIVSSNVCMLTFFQGMPMGSKYYNNYSLVQSTTNNIYTSPELYYFTTEGDEYYHKIDCPHLQGDSIIGYTNFDFAAKRVKMSADEMQYYYKHTLGNTDTPLKPCYHCIVDANYESDMKKDKYENYIFTNKAKESAYYTALAREKYNRYTTTNYFN